MLSVDNILGKDIYRSTGKFQVSLIDWRTVINIVAKFCFVARSELYTYITIVVVFFIYKLQNLFFRQRCSNSHEAELQV